MAEAKKEEELKKECKDQATEILFDIEFKSISDEQDAVKAVAAALLAERQKSEALYNAVVEYICIDEDNGFDKLKEAATAYGWEDTGVDKFTEDPDKDQDKDKFTEDPDKYNTKNPEAGAVVQPAKNKK